MNLKNKIDKKIKVIIFDFIGVLLVKKKNYRPNKMVDEIDKVIGNVTDDKLFKEKVINKYNLTEDQFSIIIRKIVNKYVKFIPLWILLQQLKKKYKLVIINNGTALTLDYFKKKHKIDSIFDLFLSSAELGIRKPDPKIYLKVSSVLKVKPNECLFIDDTIINVQGAKKVGMKGVLWDKPQNGLEEIRKFVIDS